METEVKSRNNNRNAFGIDRIVSPKPDLEPSVVPDGGYGWLILLAAVFFQGITASILTAFGTFLLFLKLEHSSITYPILWDDTFMYTPLFYILLKTISEPWNRKLVMQSTWPRLVGTAGTCLVCAGLLFLWIATNSATKTGLYVLAGILTGYGASILTIQMDILLSQYFRLKLPAINNILELAASVGLIFTPIIIGKYVVQHGVLRVLICYQTVLLQGIVVCLILKKPQYLKINRRVYHYISNTPDDEEDVFTKDTRELQIKGNSISNGTIKNDQSTSTPENDESSTSARKEWITFDENNSTETKITLHESFAKDSNADIQSTRSEVDDTFNTPRPLFSDTFVNNNTTYSFEVIQDPCDPHEHPVVFNPIPSENPMSNRLHQWHQYLKQATFYTSFFTILSTKLSEFAFYTLFPSYLYTSVESLKVHHTTLLVGLIAIPGLFFTAMTVWANKHPSTRPIFLWVFCWVGAAGYLIIVSIKNEALLLLGATEIAMGFSALQYIGTPLLNSTNRGESTEQHKILSTICGLALFLFIFIDLSYADCYKIVAILQLITGSIWCVNSLKHLRRK